jgi:ADP-ribosyl-[dinitrogen reductase] hydrolase
VRRDRSVGVVVASAAADALGAPHEFGPALGLAQVLAMTGGGPFGWAPGEWTDDTQQALAVLAPLAAGTRRPDQVVRAVEAGLISWFDHGPTDVGSQTHAVLGGARRGRVDLATTAARYQAGHPDRAGNGSLMRTGPVALIHPDGAGSDLDPHLDTVAGLAAAVSALTHPHPDAVDACVLWSLAIARAIDLPPGEPPDWVSLVGEGLDHLAVDRRGRWADRLEACRTTPPEAFTTNGWVVGALQAALAAITQTPIPAGSPSCTHLRLAVERAIRIGHDTDTVAAIAGALLGACWGATAVPFAWRRPLHGDLTPGEPKLRLADLDRLARLAAGGGLPDAAGWPGTATLLPHYRAHHPAIPVAADLGPGVRVGNVHALPDEARWADAVVSLCRVGTEDVPAGVEHHAVGLLDTCAADNPNLAFVVADTADLVAALVGERRRVFVHCVRAEHRTPAVAAGYLVRHAGVEPAAALDRVAALLDGHRPQPFLADAVASLART